MTDQDPDKPTYHRGFGGYSYPANAQARQRRVEQRAAQVFGNDFDGAMWLSKRGEVAPYTDSWLKHWELASESEEGCQAVLARLDELDPVTEKKPLPRSIALARMGGKARRRKGEFN